MEKSWNWQWLFLKAALLQIQDLNFYQACYTLEVDSALIFTADNEMKKITAR